MDDAASSKPGRGDAGDHRLREMTRLRAAATAIGQRLKRRSLALFTFVVSALLGSLIGGASDYDGAFPALGGPNGLLYDVTLAAAQPWRRNAANASAIFVAVDDATLARPELSTVPRALFQPAWARLIDGLLDAGAQKIAFDFVLAYAGSDFRVDAYELPHYDDAFIAALRRGRGRIIVGRFPHLLPAPAYADAVGRAGIGVLDLNVESDGVVRSVNSVMQLPSMRFAFSVSALLAAETDASALVGQRLLIAPATPLTEVPRYSLGALLACLASADGRQTVRRAVEGRVVMIGTALAGEDEHRAPTRFFPTPTQARGSGDACDPGGAADAQREQTLTPGALLQLDASRHAGADDRLSLAPVWSRALAGAVLTAILAMTAFWEESALTLAERNVRSASNIFMQLSRSMILGVAGPCALGLVFCVGSLLWFARWSPMGYPILLAGAAFWVVLGLRWRYHGVQFDRMYRAVGRYLPDARLIQLSRSGFDEVGEGQEREVSILLADIVGFTAFSNAAGVSPSSAVATANRYFAQVQSAIDRHDGFSDKFLGDSVLAFWNGVSDEANHTVKAFLAALEVTSELTTTTDISNAPLPLRAVVCTGRVYVGDIGAAQRRNYTIIGSAVNEAFRLEKTPDIYGLRLLISASAAETLFEAAEHPHLQPIFADNILVQLDAVELKGFDEARVIYCIAPRNDPGVSAFARGRQALVDGRRDEAAAFFDEIETGRLATAARLIARRIRSESQTRPVDTSAINGSRDPALPTSGVNRESEIDPKSPRV
jgi:adenylate cyclase